MFQKVNIPRKNWDGGKCMGRLLHPPLPGFPRMQCCVGHFCTQAGLPDNRILRVSAIHLLDVDEADIPPEVIRLEKSSQIGPIYSTNDDRYINDARREEELTKLFNAAGFDIVFFDEEIDFQV